MSVPARVGKKFSGTLDNYTYMYKARVIDFAPRRMKMYQNVVFMGKKSKFPEKGTLLPMSTSPDAFDVLSPGMR